MKYTLSVLALLFASAQAPAPAVRPAQAPARTPARAAAFDVFEASIPEMQVAMKSGRTTSHAIVQQYLTRIATYEMAYRMQTSGPELIDFAKESRKTLQMRHRTTLPSSPPRRQPPQERGPGRRATSC